MAGPGAVTEPTLLWGGVPQIIVKECERRECRKVRVRKEGLTLVLLNWSVSWMKYPDAGLRFIRSFVMSLEQSKFCCVETRSWAAARTVTSGLTILILCYYKNKNLRTELCRRAW